MATINDIDLGSDSDKSEDFNPVAAVDSDEEGATDDQPAARNKPISKRVSPSRQLEVDDDEEEEEAAVRNGNVADDDNEEDDEDDEDEEDEDEEDAVTVHNPYSTH